jgi:hypothetical protein
LHLAPLLLKFKKNCNSPPWANITKHAQFGQETGKMWDVWCKRVQCLVMGELKHIKISSLKYFIIASWPLKYKEVL